MIPEKHEYALAILTFKTYAYIIWPLATFLLGLLGYELIWSFFASVPIIFTLYRMERKSLKQEGRAEKELMTLALILFTVILFLLFVYYTGIAIKYFMT